MQSEFGSEKFSVVGVMSEDDSAARSFQLELGVNYPILAGGSESFGNWGVSSIPQSYLIDPNGVVVADDLDAMAALLRTEL